MRIGVLQFDPVFGEKEKNLERVEAMWTADAYMMVMPELAFTGYKFASTDEAAVLAEPVPDGLTMRRLESLARKKNAFIVAGIAETAGGRLYNSAVLLGPGGWIGTYRKIHLFDQEKFWFSPGEEGFRIWDLGAVKVGMMICFDWVFPEAARTLALAGADLILHPANLVLPFCPDAMVTRAIENRVFCVTADRTGADDRAGGKLEFIGQSQIVNPKGQILFRMGREEGVRIAKIDPTLARDKQVTPSNDLFKDRRTDVYRL
jgi:5-aminopentanamidase